jgi:hypothetical protein
VKIKDLLHENENIEPLYDRIINSAFFEINWKHWFDKIDPDDIKAFYENIKNHMPILYHGGKLKENQINHVIYRERPMSTQPVIHDTINQVSEAELGVRVRAMMFATRSEHTAREYGNLSIVIPVEEDYLFYYSTLVDDMFISPKVFNMKEYKEGIPEALQLFYETKEAQEVTNRINAHFGQYLKPNFASYTYKHMRNYVNTIFIRIFMSERIKKLSDFDIIVDNETIEKGKREMFNIMEMAYGMEKISNIEAHEYDAFEKELYILTKMLFKALGNYKRNWIVKQTRLYVDSIEFTKILSDVNPKAEVMLPEGDYAILSVGDRPDDDDDHLLSLIKYYIKK